MTAVPFSELSDQARLWIFPATRPLSGAEEVALRERVDRFVADWLAHGRPVIGGYDLLYSQFLMVAADEAATGVSGCSIDSLYAELKDAERELGVTLLDSSRVWFRGENGTVQAATRPEFRQLAQAGAVNGDTTVFNNTARNVGDVREGRWELPLRKSWHGKAFPITKGDGDG